MQNVKGTKILFFFVLLLFLVCINTDSKVQTGATLFKTALKVELFSCFDKGPITRARKNILAVKMNKWFGTVIWLGNLEWCICILKRKSGFLRQVFVFYSVANVGDFCSFKGCADRPEIQKFIKKNILHFPSNAMQICNYLGSGFNIPGYKGNKFFDPKSMVGSRVFVEIWIYGCMR